MNDTEKTAYIDALKKYAKAIQLRPDWVEAHYNLGLFFLKHKQLDEAIIQFKNVVALSPSSVSAHFHLGNLYLNQNALDVAEQHYAEVVSLSPEDSDALCNLGVIYLKRERPQEAIDFFTKALAYDNAHENARNNLAATFMQYDRYENAIRHYEELLHQFPNNDEYHYNIAVAYMHVGHLKKAITHFEQNLIANPKNIASLNNLASIYWRLEEKEKAKHYYNNALCIAPDNVISQYMMAATEHQKNFSKAPQEYVKNLFDNYAVQYDTHLRQELHYQLPEIIDQQLKEFVKNHPVAWNTLELGCGTGLLGAILRPHSHTLWGVDLSEKMLAYAQNTNSYDHLFADDIHHFLNCHTEKWDCVCAAEVLEYVGDLDALFELVSSHLNPEGLFIFSIETTAEKEFILQETARFAHHPDYILSLSRKYCLETVLQIPVVARLQESRPLPGCLFFLCTGQKI